MRATPTSQGRADEAGEASHKKSPWEDIIAATGSHSNMDSIRTSRRLEYAVGYLELGLFAEANEELECVANDDRVLTSYLGVRLECSLRLKQWEVVADVGYDLVRWDESNEHAWIARAFALNAMGRVEEARDVLLVAEEHCRERIGNLHFNLACYECTIGDHEEARRRLLLACLADSKWKKAALNETDLIPIWETFASLPG